MEEKKTWRDEYEELLEGTHDRVDRRDSSRGGDKRSRPRFSIKTGSVHVRLETPFEVVNVSASGIAFFSRRSFELGKIVSINCADRVKVDARIIHCRMVDADAVYLDAKYFVACRFLTGLTGKHIVLELMGIEA